MGKILDYVSAVASYPERQGGTVLAVQRFICSELEKNNIPFVLEPFFADIPESKAFLGIDGVSIQCEGCGLVSGKISSDTPVISAPTPADVLIETPIITFNPACEAISRGEYFFAPAIAIARKDVEIVRNAKNISGGIEVAKMKYEFSHILVGNVEKPKAVVFAHYDSISKGAFDNASGVAVVLHTILKYPKLLESTLFVFDPCEELSFGKPTYWGYGFRVFEERHINILEHASIILPVDGVGNGPTQQNIDPNILNLAFPLKHMERFLPKIVTIHGDIKALPAIYHSPLDVADNLTEKYLIDAERVLADVIK